MKTKASIKNFIPFIIIIIFIALARNIALAVYRAFEPITEGITGLMLLILVYRIYFQSPELKVKEPTRLLFEYPTGFRYLGIGVFWAVVNFWAIKQIFDMVDYLIKLFSKN